MADTHPVDLGVPVADDLNTVATSNEQAFARIVALYARPGHTIVDVTYGSGRFWRHIDRAAYDARCTDLTDGVDLRSTGHPDGFADMWVLDPPYRYKPARNKPQDATPGHGRVDGLYNLTTDLTNNAAVRALYVAGFEEARRCLTGGGFLVVKCQDSSQDGKQVWMHCDLIDDAEALGFACREIAIVATAATTKTRWPRQRHLRKAHSYFLVFRKGGQFPFGIPSTMKRARPRVVAVPTDHEDPA